MRVSACLIRDELDDRITVCREGLGYEEPVYSALRIYQGDTCMTSEYVYLVTEESLTGNPEIESGSCLIITGGCKTVPDWAKAYRLYHPCDEGLYIGDSAELHD